MESSSAEMGLTQRDTILDTAARCFMEQGFKAVSIDEIARRLGATKGMVYHYFDSKVELFFQIHQRGMDALFDAVQPQFERTAPAVERLFDMSRQHVTTLIDTQHYQRTIREAVQMHLRVSTTTAQRKRLRRLQERRHRYEGLFTKVIENGTREGNLVAPRPEVIVKPVFGALNSVINWHQPRYEQAPYSRQQIVEDVVQMALCVLVRTP